MGNGGRPGAWAGSSVIKISDISMNSSSKIFFTTVGGRQAAGLYGPGAEMDGRMGFDVGVSWGLAAVAAAARSLSPDVAGVKMGNWACAEAEVVMV